MWCTVEVGIHFPLAYNIVCAIRFKDGDSVSCSSCVSAFNYLCLAIGHSLAYSDVQQ